jgi:hypothetical protein
MTVKVESIKPYEWWWHEKWSPGCMRSKPLREENSEKGKCWVRQTQVIRMPRYFANVRAHTSVVAEREIKLMRDRGN